MSTATQTRPAPPATAPTVAGIPFRTLVSVEWRKAVGTRSAAWLIGLTGLAAVLIMLAPLLARHDIDQTWTNYLGFPTLVMTVLVPVVVILTLTSEWSQRSVMVTFTQEPRRNRVIAAKLVVSVILACAAVVVALLVTLAAVGIADATGGHVGNDLTAANLTGFALYVLINVLMGAAFGALLHNSAAAIVLYLVLPTAFGLLGAALHAVGDWIDPSRTFGWMLSGEFGGHLAQIAVSGLLWVVAPLVAGCVRTARREVA